MKSYKETAERVLHRRNEELAKLRRRNRVLTGSVCAVASVCVVTFTGIGIRMRGMVQEETKPPFADGDEIAALPFWEDMSISQQYGTILYHGARYTTQTTALPDGMAGERIAGSQATGFDVNRDQQKQIDAELFAISGISPACAVAAKLGDSEGYYVYVNTDYRPDTLGQLIDNLDLENTLIFGSVYGFGMRYEGAEHAMLWELLLSERSAENTEDIREKLNEISVSIDIPLLGYRNISIGITAEGYLTTNILGTGKYFYLGTEKTEQFKSYVTQHCRAYELPVGNDVQIPE